jgi:cyclic pyranopterin phosphate synthase
MIYAFEGIDETLDLLPLAARRALDRAGRKVSLAAWRVLPMRVREFLVAAGSGGRVDADRVREVLTEENVPSEALDPSDEPDADRIPDALASSLGPAIGKDTWCLLSPLDRYALAKIANKPSASASSEKLLRALSEIVVVPEPRRLSHLSARGEAHMVDVGGKSESLRRAVAHATVRMQPATAERLRSNSTPKGDVLAAARIAGIQASKRTPELIPLCHVVRLTRVTIELRIEEAAIQIDAVAEAFDRTGVEMEALVAASTAGLTIYDMLKGIDRGMTIEIALQEKTGGTSGTWTRAD